MRDARHEAKGNVLLFLGNNEDFTILVGIQNDDLTHDNLKLYA